MVSHEPPPSTTNVCAPATAFTMNNWCMRVADTNPYGVSATPSIVTPRPPYEFDVVPMMNLDADPPAEVRSTDGA